MQWVRSLCRLCGQIGDICYNIFDPNLDLEIKVKKCLNLQISEEDFKPKEICHLCYNKVHHFLQFIDICISTSMKLESIYFADFSANSKDKSWWLIEPSFDYLNNHKQSVIVSCRQEIDEGMQYRETNKDGAFVILQNCSVSQTEIIETNVKYNNEQSPEPELNTFPTSGKVITDNSDSGLKVTAEEEKLSSKQDKETTEPCLVFSEKIPYYLLDSLETDVTDNLVKGKQSKSVPASDLSISEYNASITISDSFGESGSFNIKEIIADNNKKLLETQQRLGDIGKDPCKDPILVDNINNSLETQQLINKDQKPVLIKPAKKNERLYPCPHCTKTFKHRVNLAAHISVHTNIRGFKCSNCSKTFAVKCHLTQHIKTHSELFKCQICDKSFQAPSKLSRHIQTHSSNKPFRCTFSNCNKAFLDKYNLKHHVLCHTAIKNISCNICGKLFKTRKNLSAHIKTHVSQGYECTVCKKIVRYKHNLKAHIAKHSTYK